MPLPRCSDIRAGAIFAGLAILALTSSGCSPSKPTPVPVPDPPTISCPEPLTLQSLDGAPISGTYGSPTTAKGKPPVTTACTPESGTSFPVGDTTVTCVATDASQRANSCTFLVSVKAPPRLSVTRFVAFGDSITLGEDGQSLIARSGIREPFVVPTPQTYPGALRLQLVGRYTLQSPIVSNAGQRAESVTDPGMTTVARFSNLMRSRLYDVVLLMEGSNDLSDRDDRIEPAVIANLRLMLQSAKDNNVRPYLATIPPEDRTKCCPPRGLAETLVPGLNDKIRDLARSENVPLVDVYEALRADTNTYIGFDGLHPTVAGYAKIADVFFTAIKQTLEVSAPASSLRGVPTLFATPRVVDPAWGRSRLRAR